MGLDNGILLRTKNPLPADCELAGTGYENDEEKWFIYEVCYWRKCWNIREKMFHILYDEGARVTSDDVNSLMSLTTLKKVWKMLNDFNEDNWDYPYGSIWEWVEYEDHIERDIQTIERLIQFLKDWDTDDYEIEFYDSY